MKTMLVDHEDPLAVSEQLPTATDSLFWAFSDCDTTLKFSIRLSDLFLLM